MGWGSSFSWCRSGCEGHINGWAPEGPIAMQEALTKPRPRARKRFLHWLLVDSVAPFPRTSYCGHRCDHSNFFKSLITTAMEYFVLASVPVLVSFCLQDVPKCITASSFFVYDQELCHTDRCSPPRALDPAHADREKWPHAAEPATGIFTHFVVPHFRAPEPT